MSYTVTVTETPFVVTVDGGTTVEVSPSETLTVELGYGDASVGAYLLALLTNNTALGRLSDAIAAIDALSQAEAENATSDVVGLATGRRLAQGAAVGDAAHVAASDPHTQYQKESEKDAANGYAGLNAVARVANSALALTTAGGFTYASASNAIAQSLQGTQALPAYAIDWAAADRFTKTLAGGDTFTHSNTDAKIAIRLVLTVNGQTVPSGIGTAAPGTATWDSGWTTAWVIVMKNGAGGYEYTLTGA